MWVAGKTGWSRSYHGPYLTTLEMRFMIKRYTNRRYFTLLWAFSVTWGWSIFSIFWAKEVSDSNCGNHYVHLSEPKRCHLRPHSCAHLIDTSGGRGSYHVFFGEVFICCHCVTPPRQATFFVELGTIDSNQYGRRINSTERIKSNFHWVWFVWH